MVSGRMRFGLIAADPTGACDSSVPFLAVGPVVVSLWPALRKMRGTSLGASEADHVAVLYRKIDSQMCVGNVAADLVETLMVWQTGCVLAPALPEEGRITVRGRQRWAGGDVDVVGLLRAAGLEVTSGSPADARPGTIVVCEASTNEDLQHTAGQIGHAQSLALPAGSSGLASHLPRRLTPAGPLCPTGGDCRHPNCSCPSKAGTRARETCFGAGLR